MKIAIVGAEESSWTEAEKKEVSLMLYEILGHSGKDAVFISGGCPKGGIDIWAEDIADVMMLQKQIFKPEVEQWEDERFPTSSKVDVVKIGYKSRNIQIAQACDILYCFSPGTVIEADKLDRNPLIEKWNGGIWTANYAKKLGKKVARIVVKVE